MYGQGMCAQFNLHYPTPALSEFPSIHPCTDNSTGATYDSIEGRFRIIKKEAAAMKAEIDSGQRSEAPPRGANATPKKSKSTATPPKKERTIGGRVGKGTGTGTPSKKRGNGKGVKEEPQSR